MTSKNRRVGPSGPPLLTGAILAGGLSRRLGQDKTALRLAGKPLALWVAEALAPVVTKSWLITNQPVAHVVFGLPLATDLQPFLGPAGGILTALGLSRTPWVLVAAVDNPFLAPALLGELAVRARRLSRPAVICRSARGLEPFPGIYATRLMPQLQEFLLAHRRILHFLEIHRPQIITETEVAALDPEGQSFFNLNTPADQARAEACLAGQTSLSEPSPLDNLVGTVSPR